MIEKKGNAEVNNEWHHIDYLEELSGGNTNFVQVRSPGFIPMTAHKIDGIWYIAGTKEMLRYNPEQWKELEYIRGDIYRMYAAFVLLDESRRNLLSKFPPVHDDVIAHHITYQFGIPAPDTFRFPPVEKFEVVGYLENKLIQCVVVELDGNIYRKDGSVYHITISVNRKAGGKPVMSNSSLRHEGWNETEPFEIKAEPEIIT